MSSPDKVRLLEKAQELGYRTYLYYVATSDPIINISRMKNRVRMGGHNVLAEITDGKSLELRTDRIPAWFKQAVLDKIPH